MRNAKHVALLASDPDTRTLILASDAMLALHAAVKVGVLSKMQVCYDIAVQVTSTAQLEDDNNFSLRKRVVKELAGVRRFMLSIQMTTPLLSNKTPSSKFTMSPTAHHHTALKSAMYLQHNLTGNVSPQRDSSSTAAAVVATVAAHSEITKEIARADDRVLERIIGLFEQAVANKVSAIDATMIAKDAIDKRRVSIVVKREGDVKNLLQCVVENQDRSFTLLQVFCNVLFVVILNLYTGAAALGCVHPIEHSRC